MGFIFRGNFGNIGVYYDLPEIVPAGVQGDFRFNKSGKTKTVLYDNEKIMILNFNLSKTLDVKEPLS